MNIRNLTLQPLFTFDHLTGESLEYERSGKFKELVKQRFCQIFGTYGVIPIARSEYSDFTDADFDDNVALGRLVGKVLRSRSNDAITTNDGSPPFGPDCRPDPDEPDGWLRARRVYVYQRSLKDDFTEASVGDLGDESANWPADVRKDLSELRLGVLVQWRQCYKDEVNQPGDATQSSGDGIT